MNKDFYEIHSAEYEEAQEVLREMAEDEESEITEDDTEMLFEDYDDDPDTLYDWNDNDMGFNPYMGCYDFDC